MAHWWVNQGQTYAQERAGGYLWAPKRSRNGRQLDHWEAMTDVAPDDLVVHYVGKPAMAVQSLSTVLAGARDAKQPSQLRRTGLWSDEGRQVRVRHVAQVTPLARDEAVALGPAEAPFTTTGTVKQGYLWPLSTSYGEALVDALTPPPGDTLAATEALAHADHVTWRPVETVALEAGGELQYEQVVTAARRQAIRAEWSLVERLVTSLDIEPARRRYRLPGGTTLYADLWLEEGRTLVEAKASASRRAVREAIGQLYDYAQKEEGQVSKVVLLPNEPADDLLEVLASADIVAVWPDGDGWCPAAGHLGTLRR